MNGRWRTASIAADLVRRAAVRVVIAAGRLLVPDRRPGSAADRSLLVPFGAGALDHPKSEGPRVAFVCHLFYIDLAEELFVLTRDSTLQADVLISTDTEEKRRRIELLWHSWTGGRVVVRVVPNRGRDIAPKLIAFSDVYESYDLLLFLHSKKSEHFAGGDAWRDGLFNSLLGSPDIARSILTVFDHVPSVGMVIPPHAESVRRWVTWNRNFVGAWRLGRRMGVRLPMRSPIDFPSGSMFWARPEALAPLIGLNLTWDDFPPEQGQVNRTVHHAIERLPLVSCERAGYSWLRVSTIDFPSSAPTRAVTSVADVSDFVSHGLWTILGRRGR